MQLTLIQLLLQAIFSLEVLVVVVVVVVVLE
jgi:hypothetical protein